MAAARVEILHNRLMKALWVSGMGAGWLVTPLFLHVSNPAETLLHQMGMLLVWCGSILCTMEVADIFGTEIAIKLGGGCMCLIAAIGLATALNAGLQSGEPFRAPLQIEVILIAGMGGSGIAAAMGAAFKSYASKRSLKIRGRSIIGVITLVTTIIGLVRYCTSN